jgi:hypothetical protein
MEIKDLGAKGVVVVPYGEIGGYARSPGRVQGCWFLVMNLLWRNRLDWNAKRMEDSALANEEIRTVGGGWVLTAGESEDREVV